MGKIAAGFKAGFGQYIGLVPLPDEREVGEAPRQTAIVDKIGRGGLFIACGRRSGKTAHRTAGIRANTHSGSARSRRLIEERKKGQAGGLCRAVIRRRTLQEMGHRAPVHAENGDITGIGPRQVAINRLRQDHPYKTVLFGRGQTQTIGKIIHAECGATCHGEAKNGNQP